MPGISDAESAIHIGNRDMKHLNEEFIWGAFRSIVSFCAGMLCGILLAGLACRCGRADTLEVSTNKVKPPGTLRVTQSFDLGTWNDVHTSKDLDVIILRREQELFTFSPTNSPRLKKLTAALQLASSKVIFPTKYDGRLWLFCVPEGSTPFTIDVNSGTIAEFRIPGLNIVRNRSLELQSWVLAPHVGGAVLMLARGEPNDWPRPQNRPVYFWFNLRTGASRQLPLGWDLYCCTSNQTFAAFSGNPERVPAENPSDVSHTLPLIDLRNGECPTNIAWKFPPQYWVPFEWTQKDRPKQLLTTDPVSFQRFAGIAIDGLTYSIKLPMREMGGLGWFADAREGWLAFGWRGISNPSCWLGPLLPGANVLCLGTNVIEFELLQKGRCVYLTLSRNDPHIRRGELWPSAWVAEANTKRTWNILDGITGVPTPPEPNSRGYSKMTIQLTRGVGRSRFSSAVLCLYSHTRFDTPAINATDRSGPSKWEAAILVNQEGQRFILDGLTDGNPHELRWLHNCVTLVLGTYRWHVEEKPQNSLPENALRQEVPRVHLTGYELSGPR